jgi:hypothetical protein
VSNPAEIRLRTFVRPPATPSSERVIWSAAARTFAASLTDTHTTVPNTLSPSVGDWYTQNLSPRYGSSSSGASTPNSLVTSRSNSRRRVFGSPPPWSGTSFSPRVSTAS